MKILKMMEKENIVDEEEEARTGSECERLKRQRKRFLIGKKSDKKVRQCEPRQGKGDKRE
jgi:hypothetical protein